jgi:hypothetical protein
MTFKVKTLLSTALLLLFVAASAAADFTYQEYIKAPEVWKRGFVFGISQYMSAVAQPDEEPPYPVRTAFQRCLASSTDTLLIHCRARFVRRRLVPPRPGPASFIP